MTYVMDEATYNSLRWTAENERYKGTTRKTKGHGEGMLQVLDTLSEEAFQKWNIRLSPWHTGTPTIDDPFLIKEVFILLFIHPSDETWNYHAHLFKPDFKLKCFYSWCDRRIKFPFDTKGLLWQKIEPYEAGKERK